MSYKISMILSMIFVALFFVLGIDLINLQIAYTELDQKAIAISYEIAKTGNLTRTTILNIQLEYGVTFTCDSNCSPSFGDIVLFTISDVYDPIVISNQTITISIQRTSIIGYYS